MEKTMKLEAKMNLADIGIKCGIMSICVAILAITIGSPLYLGNKIDNLRRDMQQDMKDFHGRLCTLEEKYFQLRENQK